MSCLRKPSCRAEIKKLETQKDTGTKPMSLVSLLKMLLLTKMANKVSVLVKLPEMDICLAPMLKNLRFQKL